MPVGTKSKSPSTDCRFLTIRIHLTHTHTHSLNWFLWSTRWSLHSSEHSGHCRTRPLFQELFVILTILTSYGSLKQPLPAFAQTACLEWSALPCLSHKPFAPYSRLSSNITSSVKLPMSLWAQEVWLLKLLQNIVKDNSYLLAWLLYLTKRFLKESCFFFF